MICDEHHFQHRERGVMNAVQQRNTKMGQLAMKDQFARQDGETHLEWLMRRQRMKSDARNRDDPIVSPEAANHGDYQNVTLYEVDDNGAPIRVVAKRNRATDPVERWKAKDRLSDTQVAAINHCVGLWQRAGITQRVTGTYGERIHGSSGQSEVRCLSEVQARRDLHAIQDYIPAAYWGVFENIVRHAMPIGKTALTAGYTGPGAEIRAFTVVCFVADLVAMRERL